MMDDKTLFETFYHFYCMQNFTAKPTEEITKHAFLERSFESSDSCEFLCSDMNQW